MHQFPKTPTKNTPVLPYPWDLPARQCRCLVFGEIGKRCNNLLEILLVERAGLVSGIDRNAGKTEIIGIALPGHISDMVFPSFAYSKRSKVMPFKVTMDSTGTESQVRNILLYAWSSSRLMG